MLIYVGFDPHISNGKLQHLSHMSRDLMTLFVIFIIIIIKKDLYLLYLSKPSARIEMLSPKIT